MALIHLLDDDVEVTRACAFLLESLDYEVMCWEAGEIFLSQACLYQTGVVLLDMRMPVLGIILVLKRPLCRRWPRSNGVR